MTNITTRSTAGTNATVKGSPLTNAELDGNFIALNDGKQEADVNLTALSNLTGASDTLFYFSGLGALSTTAFTALARTLLGRATSALMRGDLGLGTAAVATLSTSTQDRTAGNVLRYGDLGIGAVIILSAPDLNTLYNDGHFFCASSPTNGPVAGNGWLRIRGYADPLWCVQTFDALDGSSYFRQRVNGTWRGWESYVRALAGVTTLPGRLQAGGAIDDAAVVTIASAATVNIGAAASSVVSISGTTTITSFGTANSGVQRNVMFSGALTLTHSANLALPGAANIVTVSGDQARFVSMGGGVWYCECFLPIDGQPVRTVAVNHGGTGATDAATARTNLGLTTMSATATANQLVQRDANGYIYTSGLYSSSFMELGNMAGSASTPLIDFHSGATVVDYDARIFSDAPTGVVGGGRLVYAANGGHTFTGPVNLSSTLSSTSRIVAKGAGNDYATGAFEVDGNGAANTVYPTLGFHQPTLYAASIQLRSSTTFTFYNQGCTDYMDILVKSITASGVINASSTITATNGVVVSKAPSSGANAHFWLYGEADQSRGIVYAGADNVMHLQAGGIDSMLVGPTSVVVNTPLTITGGSIVGNSHIQAGGNVYSGNGNSFVGTDGNLYGAAWGGYATNYVLHDGNWRTKLANLRAGELGSYIMAVMAVPGGVALNSGVAGTSIFVANTQSGHASQTMPGNYYCAGYCGAQTQTTLFQRYV